MIFPVEATLMLVEDDPNDVFFMRRALKSANIFNPVHLATRGKHAIGYLSGAGEYSDRRKFPLPQVIFLDLKLPDQTGFEVLRWIQERPALPPVAVVVLTSSSQPRDIELAYQLGARSYLVKPPTEQMLRDLVASLDSFLSKWKTSRV